MRPQSASALLRGPPLSLCGVIKMGYLQQVRDLVDFGMDIDCKDGDGKTPLMLCAFLEPVSWGVGIARHLIELGASLNLRDKSGRNALHHACIYQRCKLANVLLRAIDFNLNQRDRYGNTALHYAVKSGDMDMIGLIVSHLRRYSMTLDDRNKEGMSAMDIAHEMFDTKCLQLLEEREKGSKEYDDRKREGEDEKTDEQSLASDRSERRNEKSVMEESKGTVAFARRSEAALLKRRRTSSSSTSSSSLSSSGERSKTPSNRKTPRQSTRTSERTPDTVIKCVSLSDFRNTKEYVFKLTALPYDELEPNGGLPSLRRPQSAWTPICRSYHDQQPFSWRKEFKKLYVEYEFQCSPSWRDAAKTLADQIAAGQCPPAPEDEDEKVRDRKGRRFSGTQKNLTVESIKDKRRSSGNIKVKKGSSHGKLGQDATLASSSESLSSSTSSKKRDSLIPKTEALSPRNIPPPEKETPLRGPTSPMPIPSVTETLVDDKGNGDDVKEGDSVADATKLYVLSDIDE